MIDFHSNVTNATWKLLSQDFSASGGFWWKQWLDVLWLTCVQGGPPTRYNLGEITPITRVKSPQFPNKAIYRGYNPIYNWQGSILCVLYEVISEYRNDSICKLVRELPGPWKISSPVEYSREYSEWALSISEIPEMLNSSGVFLRVMVWSRFHKGLNSTIQDCNLYDLLYYLNVRWSPWMSQEVLVKG